MDHDEPRSALVDAFDGWLDELMGAEHLDQFSALFADDLIVIDRRKLIGLPDLDKAGWLEAFSFELEHRSAPTRTKVVAVRGDRLMLGRHFADYRDGSTRETLTVTQVDERISQIQRLVTFDPHDLAAATKELDRMHAEIEAEGSSPPTR